MDQYEEIENNLLNAIIEKFDVTEYKLRSEQCSKKGDNFVGEVKKIRMEGKKENGKSIRLSFIIKQAPTDKKRREMFNCETCFIREMYMYEQVLPTLTKLEVDYRIKDKLRYPLLLGTSKQNGSETLIMEDLAMHGFEMKDRRYPLNWQHCKLVISNFARLHSLSFILKKQKPELFSKLSYLPEAFFTGEFMEMYKDKRVEDSFKRNTACLDKEKDEKLISKVRYVYDNFVDFYHFCTSGENSNGYNVICHGDGWMNNIFFKYENENKSEPSEVCLIDWQLSRHSSPIIDLLYFIYLSTDAELRQKHLDNLYEEYYTCLSNCLENFGENVEDHFPKEEFYRHIKVFSKFGLLIAFLILQFIMCNPLDSVDASDIAKDPESCQKKMMNVALNDDQFKERIRGIIIEMCERKYI